MVSDFLFKSLAWLERSNFIFRCDWADVRSGRSFVYLCTHLTRAGIYDLASIDQILAAADQCDLSDLSSDTGLANAIDFLFRLNIPFVRDVSDSSSYVVKFIQRNRLLCLNSLFQVLELDTVREIYRLPTAHALSPSKRRRLMGFFQAGHNSRGLDDWEDEEGNIVANSQHERTLNFIYRDLIQILGGGAYVQLAYPLPHATARCPVFKLGPDGRPVAELREQFSALTSRGEAASGWRIVVVAKKAEEGKDGRLLGGQIKTQLDQLRQLGHRPVLVTGHQYFAALKQKKNLSFLRKEINLLKTCELFVNLFNVQFMTLCSINVADPRQQGRLRKFTAD